MLLIATRQSWIISFGAWLCVAKNKERRTTTARSTLAKGHHRTAHGRRSLSGARSKRCFCDQEPEGSGWWFPAKQHLTLARHSYSRQRDAPAAIEVRLLSNTSRVFGHRRSSGGLQRLCLVAGTDCQAPLPRPDALTGSCAPLVLAGSSWRPPRIGSMTTLSGLTGACKARLIPQDSGGLGRFQCNWPNSSISAGPAGGAARPPPAPSMPRSVHI